MPRCRFRGGFSLVELLVVLGVMGLLAALLLPAIQAARESGRRSACLSNLHNLGVAMANYADTHGMLPTGYVPARDARLPPGPGLCETGAGDASVFLRALPFLEGGGDEHVNFRVAPFLAENQTVAHRLPAILSCPSDPEGRAHGSPAAAGLLPNARSGYLANAGALCLLDLATELPACLPNPQLREADSGVFPHRTWMKTSQIKDGLARTLLFSERAVALSAFKSGAEQWWVQSGFVSTLMSASAPPNFRGYWDRDLVLQDGYGALSMHPGGVCIALCDGSATFVSEAIDSWEHDAGTGGPRGAIGSNTSGWSNIPRPGVWQALATRAGGDGPAEF